MNDRQQTREKYLEDIQTSLSQKQFHNAINYFLTLHPGDQVEVFEMLDSNDKSEILTRLDILATAQLFNLQEDHETLEAAEIKTIIEA